MCIMLLYQVSQARGKAHTDKIGKSFIAASADMPQRPLNPKLQNS